MAVAVVVLKPFIQVCGRVRDQALVARPVQYIQRDVANLFAEPTRGRILP